MSAEIADLKPPQTEKRRKVVRKWERIYGLTKSQVAAAQAVIDALQTNPFMTRIGWEEVLGSNEWKIERAYSCSTGKLSCVEIVIGKAVQG